MAFGISAKLPLSLDEDDGVALNKDLKSVARQNLKNLILTVPGERIMIPSFGVGLPKFLFENDNTGLRSNISAKIREQVSIFMPYIRIDNILFESAAENIEIDRNLLHIRVEYNIEAIDAVDFLDLSGNTELGTVESD